MRKRIKTPIGVKYKIKEDSNFKELDDLDNGIYEPNDIDDEIEDNSLAEKKDDLDYFDPHNDLQQLLLSENEYLYKALLEEIEEKREHQSYLAAMQEEEARDLEKYFEDYEKDLISWEKIKQKEKEDEEKYKRLIEDDNNSYAVDPERQFWNEWNNGDIENLGY